MKTIAVIGTGLIGTSVALALSRRGVTVHLQDVDALAAKTAAALGAGTLDPPDGPVELAVIAVPPARTAAELVAAQRAGLAAAYTDVASVKARPGTDLTAAGGDPARYVGGHPLAGRERSGPLAADADLFAGRHWVLTPSAATAPEVLAAGRKLAELCGATPLIMDASAHDHAVALTSHTPHVVSSLMAGLLADTAERTVAVSGQGLRDVTRIAGGDAGLWIEILTGNAAAVAEVLEQYGARLADAAAALQDVRSPDPETARRGTTALTDLLRLGERGYARVPRKLAGLVTVEVTVPDRPGALARLLTAAAEAGINVEDVRIEHLPDRAAGHVKLQVSQDAAAGFTELLRAHGWPT